MRVEKEKPLYFEYHEAFRRLLIMGGISLVIGLFFADQVGSTEIFPWLDRWFATFMVVSGVVIWSLCFLAHPRQYSIYGDRLEVEAWYPRRKVVPFDEITELKAWTNMGRRQIIVLSRGENYSFGFTLLSPRRIEPFAERLEEAMNRRRFYAGREPIQITPEARKEKKGKGKGKGKDGG